MEKPPSIALQLLRNYDEKHVRFDPIIFETLVKNITASAVRFFDAGNLVILLHGFQKKSQKELADKLATKRSYISRIESASSDIRLSTLRKIVEEGLGGKLRISIDL